MQLMLEDSGAFSNHCSSNNDDNTSNNATTESQLSPCPEQTSMLLNVQFTAMLISMIFTPLMGAAIDKYGAAPLITVAFTIGGVGLTLLIITSFHTNNENNIDGLLFPSFICFGFMSCLTGLYTVQTGLLYDEGRDRNRVISVLNALLDSGAVTYLLLWYIEGNTRLTLSVISMIYFGFYVLVMGTAVVCWNIIGKNNMKEALLKRQLSLVQMDEVQHDAAAVGKENDDDDDDKAVEDDHDDCQYILIANRPQKQQLLSSQYITLGTFFAFHQARNTWILTTTRDFLAYLGDNEENNRYLSIFTLLTPVSVLGLPFVDWILHKYGYAAGLHACNLLGICQGIVQVSSTNLNIQIIGFVFYSFYRCFLFSVVFSALAQFLRGDVMGKGCGLYTLSGGVLGLAFNLPLSWVAVNKLDGNFFIPNLVYLLGCFPCVFLCHRVGSGFAKEEMKKKEIASGAS
jgi:MFS family permease